MSIIGRVSEQEQLKKLLNSNNAEFLVIYGRRRVGKTFLIKEFFNETFSFYSTGVLSKKAKDELTAFNQSLKKYGSNITSIPKNWFDAFERLQNLIESEIIKPDSRYGKITIFLDELPWMDTVKSDFKAALDFFWNSYLSSKKNILLIVCGSATSWILNNLLNSKGGFYNRVTSKIHLKPFNLYELEKLVNEVNKNSLTKKELIEAYMIFGGIPYYLNLINPNFSLVQNIDNLFFKDGGMLENEFNILFSSLFNNYENHIKIIEALATNQAGLTRNQLLEKTKLSSGQTFTKILDELIECGFIKEYKNYIKAKNVPLYQIIDPFTLFAFNFLVNKKSSMWQYYIDTPSYYSWCGHSFETVCLNHIYEIKKILGIDGIDSLEYSYFDNKKGGAQIDLIIDRKDNVINLCEMKFSNNKYNITDQYKENIINKVETLRNVSKNNKQIVVTFITLNGINKSNSDIVRKEILANELFIQR